MLDPVHGLIGGIDESGGTFELSVFQVDDADRGGDVQRLALGLGQRLTGQVFANALGQYPGLLPARIGHDHQELLAAVTPGDIALAHHVAQRRGEVDQHFVAEAMPEAVIDALEVVQVDEHHRERLMSVLGQLEMLFEAFLQPRAIGQLREVIGAVLLVQHHVTGVQRLQLALLLGQANGHAQVLLEQQLLGLGQQMRAVDGRRAGDLEQPCQRRQAVLKLLHHRHQHDDVQ